MVKREVPWDITLFGNTRSDREKNVTTASYFSLSLRYGMAVQLELLLHWMSH